MARGPIGSHSTSPFSGPRNLSSSLAWSWQNPKGRYADMSIGALLIDDELNLYAGFSSGIRKFSIDGELLWEYQVEGGSSDIPAIKDGVLYITSNDAHVHAVNMTKGELLWKSASVCSWDSLTTSKCHSDCNCHRIGGDIGAVAVHQGIVVVKTHEPPGGGACRAAGLNATNGEFLWDYAANHLIWNFYPIINDDGASFLFQDSTGGVYHLGLDGREIWAAGVEQEGWRETFTDGGLQLGPNGAVYAVKAYGDNKGPGTVRAYRIADGAFMWESPQMPYPPNSWPVIGRLRKADPLTVMAPFGTAGEKNGGGDLIPGVWGLDAETGQLLWQWSAPAWKSLLFRSDAERLIATGSLCIPNPCGNPTLDVHGRFYVGMLDGVIYQLEADGNGPGVKISSTFDAQAAFSNGGTSIAPGMMAIVSCDTLFVFKD